MFKSRVVARPSHSLEVLYLPVLCRALVSMSSTKKQKSIACFLKEFRLFSNTELIKHMSLKYILLIFLLKKKPQRKVNRKISRFFYISIFITVVLMPEIYGRLCGWWLIYAWFMVWSIILKSWFYCTFIKVKITSGQLWDTVTSGWHNAMEAPLETSYIRGWRDGSHFKGTSYSYKRPRLRSHHPHSSSQLGLL